MTKQSRVVAITGASAGVGRAVAHGFAREGARIGLLARSRAAARLLPGYPAQSAYCAAVKVGVKWGNGRGQ